MFTPVSYHFPMWLRFYVQRCKSEWNINLFQTNMDQSWWSLLFDLHNS